MHLVYIPVIHTKDKEGKEIDKICYRDFEKEIKNSLDAEKQIKHEEREKEWELER